MGRKKIEIDFKLLDNIFAVGGTLTMAANIMDISHDVIEIRIKEKTGLTAGEYREAKLDKTKVRLQQKAIDMALNKNNITMLIFCLKNLCKWTDKLADEELDEQITVNVKSLRNVN